MAADVNAAIRGARAAGADRIVIKDSHGNSKNLLIDLLEPGVELITGYGARGDGMMAGIDETFHASCLIGYHAMAGTHKGVMEHTISGRVHRMWLNGMLAGEIALSAATSGQYGVPLVAVSSDTAGCAEAAALIPGLKTAIVKDGFGRYMTQTKHPAETSSLIEQAVYEGIVNRQSIRPWLPGEPVTARIEFNRTEEADMAEKCPGVSRVDAYSVEATADWKTAHRTIWTMIVLAQAGFDANN